MADNFDSNSDDGSVSYDLSKSYTRSKSNKRAKVACVRCNAAHALCDDSRPCKRCVKAGFTDCVDKVRKPRVRSTPKPIYNEPFYFYNYGADRFSPIKEGIEGETEIALSASGNVPLTSSWSTEESGDISRVLSKNDIDSHRQDDHVVQQPPVHDSNSHINNFISALDHASPRTYPLPNRYFPIENHSHHGISVGDWAHHQLSPYTPFVWSFYNGLRPDVSDDTEPSYSEIICASHNFASEYHPQVHGQDSSCQPRQKL